MSNRIRSADAATRSPVVIERSYRARVEELWDLWTTKEGFESWWGPEGFRADVYTLDACVGGILHYSMIADAPEQIEAMKRLGRPISHEVRARFCELTPLRRLELTNMIDFLPGVEPDESTILVEFFPSGESVRMVVTLEPLHDEEFTRMSIMGFTSQLTKLDRRFGQQTR
ncbi:MAG: SRPBCC domain-containing protein [Bradyrhizobiaceae bacterium]|nr:SRPBCC domain-containing protein [Hyphomicrobiales bacterium]MBV9428690.1 SRPBCC domain-containing protein [Bradyrhizobiaceae bacterium]